MLQAQAESIYFSLVETIQLWQRWEKDNEGLYRLYLYKYM